MKTISLREMQDKLKAKKLPEYAETLKRRYGFDPDARKKQRNPRELELIDEARRKGQNPRKAQR